MQLLKVAEAAERLRLSRSKTYELISQGRIRSVKIGAVRRIPETELAKFVLALLADEPGPAPAGHTGEEAGQ